MSVMCIYKQSYNKNDINSSNYRRCHTDSKIITWFMFMDTASKEEFIKNTSS
jgi:hypothetical protein